MTLLQNLILVSMLLATPEAASAPGFVVTIPPLAMVVQEIGEGRAQVHTLLPPGASPHTYEPRPSDVKAAQRAVALFLVARSLDGWAATLPVDNRVEILPLLPPGLLRHLEEGDEKSAHAGHDHGKKPAAHAHTADCVHEGLDAHVWMDPILMQDAARIIREKMCAADPPGCELYTANEAKFSRTLRELDEEIRTLLQPVKGRGVALMHDFLGYFLARYGFPPALLVAPVAGKEPTPKSLRRVIETIRAHKIKAIFSELQISDRPAVVVAESTGLRVRVLDPMGGGEGRTTYRELLLYNARTLLEGLRD